jgi:serine/threonine protein kinase
MDSISGAVDDVDALTGSLESSSLSDDIEFEKDGDYIIDNENLLPFECKKVLGNGWSSVVEKVEDRRTKETFANKVIKFPRGKTKSREQAKERYYNEIAIIRNLNPHFHVVELFATYMTPRLGGLLLRPAADEGDLQQYLDNYVDAVENNVTANEKLSRMVKTLQQAFGCLSEGLAYMHAKGIRHKDIKPGNILVHQGIVIYTDFGASKDTTKDGQCTTEGRPESLTRRYCAPEVLEYDKRNFAADVFSLGCVFVEILLRLSGLTEHEDLEDEGYSGIMEALHALLLSAEIPSNLRCLLDIVILMTLKDAGRRPGSEAVAAHICCHESLSCSQCYSIRPQPQPQLRQDFQSPQTQPSKPHTPVPHASQLQLSPNSLSEPEWSVQFQRYLLTVWNEEYQRNFWNHYVEGR